MGDKISWGSKAEFMAGYTYEDMKRFGFISSSYAESHPNNLTGRIHPIFDPDQWMDNKFDKVMTPVFRLATNILLSPDSLRFLYNVFYAKRKLLVDLSKQLGREARQFDPIKDVPFSKVKSRTTALLDQLAYFVHFKWFDPSDHPMSPPPGGFCQKSPRDVAWMTESNEPTGYCSSISMNVSIVEKLAQLCSSAGGGGEKSSHILRLQFMLANFLCHELVHALNYSITLETGVAEPFFENERIAELGNSWDSAVFKGSWSSFKDSFAYYPFCVVKWPGFERRATNVSLERRLPPPQQTTYFIPMDWIARIQQDNQWQSKDPQHYISLLRIPRTRGFREYYPHDDFDRNWKSSDSSDMDYPKNDASQVMREPWFADGHTTQAKKSSHK